MAAYVYTARRHIQVRRVGIIQITACGMELSCVPARFTDAMFDCPLCFEKDED